MDTNFEATLEVNNMPIPLDPFPEQFIARTVVGAISSLKGVDSIDNLELTLLHGEVRVHVNGTEIEMTHFPNDIVAGTVAGLVSSLKGVEDTENVTITVNAR